MGTLVSIITPTYNRYQILSETLDSVFNQTYQNWECIIIDDGSNDYTKEVCSFYVDKDKRFKLFENIKDGAASARNLALKYSCGSLIQFLDSDDLISAEKLKNQVDFLEEKNDYDIVTCRWGRFEGKDIKVYKNLASYGNFASLNSFLEALTKSFGFFPLHAYLFRKELIERSGQWNERLTLNDDSEFVFRQLINAQNIGFIPDGNAYYRTSNKLSLSKYNDKEKIENAILAWRIIDLRLRLIFNKEHFFIKKEKNQIFLKLKNTFPKLIYENQDFFEQQIQADRKKRSLAFRLSRKINHIFKK